MTMCLHEWMIYWLLLRMEELIINSFTNAGSSQKKPLQMRAIASSQTACTQIKRARTLMSAAKWPPHLACCLRHPSWRKAITWLRLTKSNAFLLIFQLAVAPTWSWGRNSSSPKEVLRAWLRSAPGVDAPNQAPVMPRQPAPLPPPPTVVPLCPQLPLLPLHQQLQHHPGWVEAGFSVAEL